MIADGPEKQNASSRKDGTVQLSKYWSFPSGCMQVSWLQATQDKKCAFVMSLILYKKFSSNKLYSLIKRNSELFPQ